MLSGFGSCTPAHGAFGFLFSNLKVLGMLVFLGFCACGKEFWWFLGMVMIWGRELLLLGQKCLRFLLGVLVCV